MLWYFIICLLKITICIDRGLQCILIQGAISFIDLHYYQGGNTPPWLNLYPNLYIIRVHENKKKMYFYFFDTRRDTCVSRLGYQKLLKWAKGVCFSTCNPRKGWLKEMLLDFIIPHIIPRLKIPEKGRKPCRYPCCGCDLTPKKILANRVLFGTPWTGMMYKFKYISPRDIIPTNKQKCTWPLMIMFVVVPIITSSEIKITWLINKPTPFVFTFVVFKQYLSIL